MYLNKVMVIGNLTRDPESKALPSGVTVTSFSVATNRVWKDKDGAKQEDVEYHNIVTFGRTAETVAQYMFKGSQIYVEGRLQTRSWEDKTSGEKKYRTEIIAELVQFGSKPKGEGGGGSNTPTRKPAAKPKEKADEQWDALDDDSVNPDDIPF